MRFSNPSSLILLPLLLFVACVHHEPRADAIGEVFERSPREFMVVAHRGASGVAPENTMAAFQVAADLGVPFELDTQICKSGEMVVIHDYTVDRTTDGTGRVADLTLAELKKLDAGSHFSDAFRGQRIPTLAETLERFAGRVLVDIEIKYEGPSDEAHLVAEAVAKTVREGGFIDRVFVTAFNPYVLEALKNTEPALLRGQLYSHFEDSDIPFYQKVVLRNLLLNDKSDPDFLAPHKDLINPDYVAEYQSLGYRILPFTVNEAERIQRFMEWEVDGIITDFPARAIELRN